MPRHDMMLCSVLAGAVGLRLAAAKSDGTCGYQCTEDAECGGCGTAGKCSCPDGRDVKFYQTSCTCVSAPAGAPTSPPASVEDSVWPDQWTADVDAWEYGDFSDKPANTAKGHFYYDATLGKTRGDWSPYINGKDCKQVWIGATSETKSSKYYVKAGPICIVFPITDPGQNKALVGIERPDWMRQCNTTGFGHYVGREQVQVGTTNVWADHWSCRLDYAAANQSITFQNWHSLGLDGVPKGLPIRVTGGNSAPNPTRGSPRLNSVWYQNFAFGPSATSPDDFKVPNFGACIPVGADDVERFFGHPVKPQHLLSPAFHSRAHFLPHARPSTRDLIRAKRPKPTSAAFVGDDFASAMQKLNHVLKRDEGLMVKECGDFSLPALHEMRRLLFDARSPELDDVYLNSSNTRRMAHASVESLDTEHRRHMDLESTSPELVAKARDGACHEAVLWYIHHLSESARAAIKDKLVLPLLPERFHEAPLGQPHPVHIRYQEQASCAICHVKPPASEAITFV